MVMSRGRLARTATIVLIALGMVAALVATGPAGEADASGNVVTFTVDHTAHTITIEVAMAFYVRPALTANDERRAELLAAVERIRADIAAFWGNQYFLCYKVLVKPAMRVVDDQADVGPQEVGIRLFPQFVSLRGFDVVEKPGASVAARGTGSYLSESPDDRVDPNTGPPTTNAETGEVIESRWPLDGSWGVYSHEFGHILGLDDSYDTTFQPAKGYSPPAPGAVDDMMRLQGQPLDPTSMTRLIRRSGQVKETEMKCSLSGDMPSAILGLPGVLGGTVGMHIWTCKLEPPSSAGGPPAVIQFTGNFDLTGAIVSPFGSAAGSGSVPITPSLTVGDALFTAIAHSGEGYVEVNQTITWEEGRPRSTFSNATLTKVLPINSRVVFTDNAKECP